MNGIQDDSLLFSTNLTFIRHTMKLNKPFLSRKPIINSTLINDDSPTWVIRDQYSCFSHLPAACMFTVSTDHHPVSLSLID